MPDPPGLLKRRQGYGVPASAGGMFPILSVLTIFKVGVTCVRPAA